MSHPYCDLCDEPATHFYNFARAAAGRPSLPGPTSVAVSLCDAHAEDFEMQQFQHKLDQLRKSFIVGARLAELPASVTFSYVVTDGDSLASLQQLLRQKSEPSVKPEAGYGNYAFDVTCEIPVPPDVAMQEWFAWLATTGQVRGCRMTGYGLNFDTRLH
jgi:hypothetical protein